MLQGVEKSQIFVVLIFPTQCKCLLLYFLPRVQVGGVLGGMGMLGEALPIPEQKY